jgi:hypothetical protein
MSDPKPILKRLLNTLALTRQDELDCSQVHHLLDIYTDAVARNEDTSELLPEVKHHFDLCPDCFEEYEALLRILQSAFF